MRSGLWDGITIDPGFRNTKFREENWNEKYYEYRQKWDDNPQRGITAPYPLNLDIESTNRCNLACPFCVRETMKDKDGKMVQATGDMDMGMYRMIMHEIKGQVPAIKLNWRGEPTLHPDLVEMVRLAKKAGVIEVLFNTNGTKMPRSLFYGLHQAGLDRIIFSIDSINPERYAALRIGASFEKVIDNLKSAVKYRKELGSDKPYIRVQKIDLPMLKDETPAYIDFFRDIGVDSVAINTYKEKHSELVDWEPLQCAQPFQRLVITWDGYYLPCCQGQVFKPIGHISGMTVQKAWLSPLMRNMRTKHFSNKQKEIEQCRRCETTKPA